MKLEKLHKIFILLLFIGSWKSNVLAQQTPQQSQFLYNTAALNPAYAGYNDRMSFFLSNRLQWVGLDGAPFTQTFAFGIPVMKDKLNVGMYICNESIGAKGITTAQGNISYHIRLKEGYLSFGLRGGIINWRVKRDELNYQDATDPSSLLTSSNSIATNFDAGITFANKGFIFGASAFNLNEPVFYNSLSPVENGNKLLMHVYSYMGYKFKLNEKFSLRPTALVKYVENAPINFEANLALIINDKFHTAISYRSSGMIAIMAQMYLNNHLHIGYSFDYTMNDLKNYSSVGSHEIFVGHNLFSKSKPMVTPRFL